MLHSSHSCYSLTVYSPFWWGDMWIYINLYPKKSLIFPQKSRYIGIYRVISSEFSTPIPNFIVDPTPLFLRENKPRRFLEPCYCIMGRLVSQERNRNLFSLFQNDPQGFPSASPLFYHTFLLSSIKKDEPLLRMTHFQYSINYSVSSSRTYRMISPTSQSSILQNISILSTWIVTRNGVS